MALIPPFFLDCVVAIGYRDQNNSVKFSATGFLVGKLLEEKNEHGQNLYSVFLVTNRHVLEGQRSAVLRFNPDDDAPAREYDLPLLDENLVPLWGTHQDPEIDVAVASINPNFLKEQHIKFSIFEEDRHVLKLSGTAASGLTEGNGVFILGFPFGHVGVERNYVLVRQGAIARIRHVIAGHSKDFLVDAFIFPGNSGGPVVTRPEAISIQGTPAVRTADLIGIVSSYVSYQDVAISQQTSRARIVFEENSGLANVVPIDRAYEAISDEMVRLQAAIEKTPDVAVDPESEGGPER